MDNKYVSGKVEDVNVNSRDISYAALVFVVFLLGIVPIGWYYLQSLSDLDMTRKQLRKAEIYNLLATSIIETKDDDYKAARENAGEFFNRLQMEKSRGDDGFLSEGQCEKINFIIENRDEIIFALDRKDDSSLEHLKKVRTVYLESVGKGASKTVVWK